jgi:putative salt-induced outer membrane protein YdiY
MRSFTSRSAIALSLVLVSATGTLAQDDADEPPRWSVLGDFGFTSTSGNSDISTFSYGLYADYYIDREQKRNLLSLNGSAIYSTDQGNETANRGDLGLRYDYKPHERFFIYAILFGSYNKPAGLDQKIAPGAGVGYRFIDTDRVKLDGSVGPSYIRDRFVDSSTRQAWYATFGEAFKLTVNDKTDLVQNFAVVPSNQNTLVHFDLGLVTELWKFLTLNVSFVDDFDSNPFTDPVTGIQAEKNDITFVAGVGVKFLGAP